MNITNDSRKVKKGDIFVVLPNKNGKEQEYIDMAIAKGASSIVAEKDFDTHKVPLMVVSDAYAYLVNYLKANISKELQKLRIVGITGTNGKTTTAYVTYQLLNALGMPTAYMGTIGFHTPLEQIELPNTTPEIITTYELLLDAINQGCKTVVMEVSSHALAQHRLEGIEFDIAAFTNLTQDHLDYHKSMREYLSAKLKIKDHLKKNGRMIINADDPYGKFFWTNNALFVGRSGNGIMIDSYEFKEDGTSILFSTPRDFYQVQTNLVAEFNVYNYLMALGIAGFLGYQVEDIIKETPTVYGPKGRCEKIPVANSFAIIDYAHTPDAVEKIIAGVRSTTSKKIMTIIGCGGDRDHSKRPIMGNIAVQHSDYVIFTSDNPRTEDPNQILQDVISGVGRKKNYMVIENRKDAIMQGLSMMEEEYVVLILGKGHEDYQIIGTTKHRFDDSEVVQEYIKHHKDSTKTYIPE